MQPFLAITAAQPGLIYINGSLAGETGSEGLLRPISARGAVYLEYRPFGAGHCPAAHRLVFSGGRPIEESLEGCEGLRAVLWPGGVTEIELLPERFGPDKRLEFTAEGHAMQIESGMQQSALYCGGRRICTLPPGMGVPSCRRMQHGVALMGTCPDGQYLLTLDAGLNRQTGLLCAQQIGIEPDEGIRALIAQGDLAGHARLETWRLGPDGLYMLSAEPVWANAAPRWPQTPEETMRAAVEAALAGLDGEYDAYLAPMLRGRLRPDGLREMCDLCVEMKYRAADSRPAVGLLRLKSDMLAEVQPLYFRAVPSGGMQGPWQISEIEFGQDS